MSGGLSWVRHSLWAYASGRVLGKRPMVFVIQDHSFGSLIGDLVLISLLLGSENV